MLATPITDAGGLGVSVSLEYVWKIRTETPLADVRRIGIEALLGDLGVSTSISDVWRIDIEISLVGVWGLGTGAFIGDI